MVGFVGNVPLVISLFGLEMEIQKTVRDLDIKKKGVSILWEATGFWGEGLVQKALKTAPFRWRKMASNQNLKMVTIDFEIGGWDMPSFKTSLNLKNGGWEVSPLSFWEGRFSGI